ncbi:hypothetical protein MBANPS3_004147 [Mucor bainieri]
MASSTWSQLPTEIQQKIFKQLGYHELLQLQQTCKSWHAAAGECFYKVPVNILKSHGGKIEKLLERTLKTPGHKARGWIKELIIAPETEQSNKLKEFNTLLVFGAMCPNLTTIRFLDSSKREFYECLLALRQLGHLQKLKCIGDPRCDGSEDYNAVARVFKNSLEELYLWKGSLVSNDNDSLAAAFPMAQYLQDFTQLKDLYIEISKDINLARIDDLLETCSNSLESIFVEFKNTSDESTGETIARQFEQTPKLNNIKLLEVYKDTLNDQEMVYIMQRFPALNGFTFYRGYPPPPPNTIPTHHSVEIICQFLQYLKNIPRLGHSIKLAPDAMCTVVTHLSKYWKVDALRISGIPESSNDRFAYITINSSSSPSTGNQQAMSYDIQIELPSFDINPLYELTLKAFSGKIVKFCLMGDEDESEVNTEATTRVHTDTEVAKFQAYNESLGFMFDGTAGLTEIVLQGLRIYKPPISITTSTTRLQLDSLEISQCIIYPETFIQWSQRLSFVKEFTLSDIAGVSQLTNPTESQRELNILMPYTVFGEILACYEGSVYLLTLSTDTTTRFYDCSDFNNDLKQVSKEEYKRIKTTAKDILSINIFCRECSMITNMLLN